jgi:hypothetical protein
VHGRDELDDRQPVSVRLVAAPLARRAVDEREERERVPVVEPNERRAAARPQRSDDEGETVCRELRRGLERSPEAAERLLARVAEPRLRTEIVDRHERAATGTVGRVPVIAPAAHRCVLEAGRVVLPAVAQRGDDRARLEPVGRRPHTRDVTVWGL